MRNRIWNQNISKKKSKYVLFYPLVYPFKISIIYISNSYPFHIYMYPSSFNKYIQSMNIFRYPLILSNLYSEISIVIRNTYLYLDFQPIISMIILERYPFHVSLYISNNVIQIVSCYILFYPSDKYPWPLAA